MKIWTSSWFEKLPDTIQKIGVSRGTPRGYPAGFRKMPELSPGPWFNTASIHDYKQLFFEGLTLLDPRKIVAKIEDLSAGKDAALLCYEAPAKDEDWCHRGYLSAWLSDTLGIKVFEYGLEDRGAGWAHPKIPRQYRTMPEPEPIDVAGYIGSEATDSSGRTWTVLGFDPENVDQAMVESNGERRSISGDILRAKFQPVV